MIEGCIAVVFGPFFLGGILIVGVCRMAGLNAQSVLSQYIRGVATLFMWILVPICKGLTSLMMQVGDNLCYVTNNNHKPVNMTDYSVHVVPPSEPDASQSNNSANKSEKKTEPSYDEPIDVDIIDE